MHYGKVKIVDISESVVSQYLESQHKLTRTRLTDIPLYLLLEPNNPALAAALITSQGFSGEATDMFLMMACLSLFETDERMSLFLSGCLSSISAKVRAIIQTDISASWTLGAIALQLHMSESLLKTKLKNEGGDVQSLVAGRADACCCKYVMFPAWIWTGYSRKMRLFKQVLLYFCISPLLWLPARQICIQARA
ncbi:putative ARAC-type regulatory protein [Escherichia coli DEC8B]|nr:putative ARAC-type regulatory protein [Escherichia coli DEC8B]